MILACCILLCGCSATVQKPELQLCRAKKVTAEWDDVLFVLTMTEDGCTFSFDAPETLSALTLTYAGETLTASCHGVETEVPTTFAAMLLPLYEGIKACGTVSVESAGKGIRRFSLDGNEFLLYYDPEGGTVTRLEVKGAEGNPDYRILSCLEKE